MKLQTRSAVVPGLALLATLTCSKATPVAITAPSSANDPAASDGIASVAIVDVAVLPMDSDRHLQHQTVIVRDGRVVAMSANEPVPQGAVVIDGSGRYLMPGLTDMHVHVVNNNSDVHEYLKNGVTTVRNMWGYPGIQNLQRDIASGKATGPTIISASPGVDAPPSPWPGPELLTDPRDADALVVKLKGQGWPFIKVYSSLSLSVYDALADAAKAHDIPFVGHVPLSVSIEHALAEHQRSVEHLGGYDRAVSVTKQSGTAGWINVRPELFAGLATMTKNAGTWNCPTMVINATLARQGNGSSADAIIQHRREFIRALDAGGAELLVGTDAGIGVVAPGSSMHDELAEFVAAGFSPYQSLHLATSVAARFLNRPDAGTIAPGMQADLLLLDADPTTTIANSRRIAGIVLRGKWLSIRELDN